MTDMVDLSAWPEGSRPIARRERPHPGAQFTFTDDDGDRSLLPHRRRARRHRELDAHRPHAESRTASGRQGHRPSKFPFKDFQLNEVWLEIVMLAHDLIVWNREQHGDWRAGQGQAQRSARTGCDMSPGAGILRPTREAPPAKTWPWAAELAAGAFAGQTRTSAPAGSIAQPGRTPTGKLPWPRPAITAGRKLPNSSTATAPDHPRRYHHTRRHRARPPLSAKYGPTVTPTHYRTLGARCSASCASMVRAQSISIGVRGLFMLEPGLSLYRSLASSRRAISGITPSGATRSSA